MVGCGCVCGCVRHELVSLCMKSVKNDYVQKIKIFHCFFGKYNKLLKLFIFLALWDMRIFRVIDCVVCLTVLAVLAFGCACIWYVCTFVCFVVFVSVCGKPDINTLDLILWLLIVMFVELLYYQFMSHNYFLG